MPRRCPQYVRFREPFEGRFWRLNILCFQFAKSQLPQNKVIECVHVRIVCQREYVQLLIFYNFYCHADFDHVSGRSIVGPAMVGEFLTSYTNIPQNYETMLSPQGKLVMFFHLGTVPLGIVQSHTQPSLFSNSSNTSKFLYFIVKGISVCGSFATEHYRFQGKFCSVLHTSNFKANKNWRNTRLVQFARQMLWRVCGRLWRKYSD